MDQKQDVLVYLSNGPRVFHRTFGALKKSQSERSGFSARLTRQRMWRQPSTHEVVAGAEGRWNEGNVLTKMKWEGSNWLLTIRSSETKGSWLLASPIERATFTFPSTSAYFPVSEVSHSLKRRAKVKGEQVKAGSFMSESQSYWWANVYIHVLEMRVTLVSHRLLRIWCTHVCLQGISTYFSSKWLK